MSVAREATAQTAPVPPEAPGPPETTRAVPQAVADLSPMAEAGGRENREKVTRVVSAHLNVGARLIEIWRARELLAYLVRTEI